jgi:hypothetical protein
VTSAPGYALRLGGDAVDAWAFEDEVRQAASRPSQDRGDEIASSPGEGPPFVDHAEQLLRLHGQDAGINEDVAAPPPRVPPH